MVPLAHLIEECIASLAVLQVILSQAIGLISKSLFSKAMYGLKKYQEVVEVPLARPVI